MTPAPSSAATPSLTGLTGRIAFTRAGGDYGDETLFVANIDGSNEARIGDPGSECCPWALRDGSKLLRVVARAPDGRLDPVVTDFSGANPVQLKLPAGLQFGSGPLSPDGKLVVLEGFNLKMESDHTYIGALANSTVRVLTDAHYIPGDFSPDGKRVLLFKGPDGSPPPPGQLSIVDVGGANLHRLTPDGVAVQCCFNFRWSPDGSKIVFARPDGGLWTVAPDGTRLTEVFHDAAGRWAITTTWSPDGSMILFALDPAADPFEHPVNGLYAIRADGTGLTLILGGSDFKREPIWVEG